MTGRRGYSGRKTAAIHNCRAIAQPQTSVNLAIEPSRTWDNRLRKRGCGEPVETLLVTPKVASKRSKKIVKSVAVVSSQPIGIIDLPNEVLVKIFATFALDDLMSIERVCRRFRSVATRVIWPSISVLDNASLVRYPPKRHPIINIAQTYNRKLTDNAVKMVLARANIREIDLPYHLITYQIGSALNMAQQLTSLNLSGIRLTNTSLRNIGRYCVHLESVLFESCFCDGSVEKGLEVLFSKCKNIKYLNLAENNKLEGECFGMIPETVAYLNLAGCYNIPVSNLDKMVTRLSGSLRTLVLENYENANLNHMNAWLEQLSKLKRLELSSWFVTVEDGQHINFSHLLDLEVLKLTYNFLVSTQALSSLRFCKKLRSVDLSYGMGMQEEIYPHLKNIKTLEACSFDGWGNVNERIIPFIKEMKLKAVSLGDCMSITHETIIKMVTECKTLRRITLRKLTEQQEISLSKDSFSTTEIKQRMESNRCEINLILKGVNFCICPVSDKDYFAVRQNHKEFKSEYLE